MPAKRSGGVVEELRKHPEVKEAAAVYGETHVVAKLQTSSLEELERLIMDGIQGNPEVKSTGTFVAVEKLHRTR